MTKRLKRILAFLCALALSVSTILGASIMNGAKAAEEPTPVTLDGYETITIKDFVDDKGNPMPAGAYEGASTGAHNVFYADGLTNLDKKLLTMKIKYEGGDYKHSLIFGGNGGWCGFNLRPSGDGSTLFIDSTWAGDLVDKSTYSAPFMKADVAGLTSFVNNEFLLQMSLSYGEVDANNKADLTIGIYINGNLYNNQTFVIPGCNMAVAGNVLALYREVNGSSIIVGDVKEETIKPVELDGFKTITVEDFADGNGAQMQGGEYEGDTSGAHSVFYAKGLTNFDKKLVSMKVLFEGGDYKHSIIIAGTQGWQGFNIHPTGDGSSLVVDKTWGAAITSSETPVLSATAAGLTSFINNEFLLQMSFEYGEVDANNKADLTLGIYINGKLYNNEKFSIADCSMDAIGNVMALYREIKGSSIIVNSINEEEPDAPEEPGQPTEFTDVTIKDFVDNNGGQAQEKAYGNTETSGTLDAFHLKNQTSFDKLRLSMKVKFEGGGGNTRIDIGGKGVWTGLSLFATEDGNNLYVYDNYGMTDPKCIIEMNKETAGVASFLNKEFLLQMTFEFDNAKNLKLGIYINETLYNDSVFTVAGCDMSKFGSYIGLYRERMDSVITIASYPEVVVERPSEDLTEVTFADLSIRDKEYPAVSGDLAVRGEYSETLTNTLVGGEIQLDGTGLYQVIFGGQTNTWDGLRMMVTDNHIHTYWYAGSEGTFIKTLYPNVAGVDFVGEKYKLQVSLEVVGDDIKVGYWFNGALYENTYEVIAGHASELGGRFGVYCEKADDKVTIGTPSADDDDTPKQPNTKFEKLTFGHFSIKDKEYLYNGDTVVQSALEDRETLDKTVICGDVTLKGEGSFQLLFGGNGNIWNGLRLIADKSAMHVYWYQGHDGIYIKSLMPLVAGTEFVNTKMNLMVSTEIVGKDVKIGIWINGVLYENEYIIVEGQAKNLGNMFGAYCSNPGASVVLNSIAELAPKPEEPKKLNEDFKKITFTHFEVKNGKHKYDGTDAPTVQGRAERSLDRTVLCGDIRIDGVGNTHLMYGGLNNVWYGFRFIVLSNGSIALYWIDEEDMNLIEIFDSTTAETPLIDKWVNWMISTEIVDADGDGEKDDIELGIWFNNVLYKNKYLTVLDKASGFGQWFGFDCATEGTAVSVKSIADLIEGFNYAAYGFTENWEEEILGTGFKSGLAVGGSQDAKPFTADEFSVVKAGFWVFGAVAALVAGIYIALQKKKEII